MNPTPQDDLDKQARISELEYLLHKGVCEVMCGWSNKCDVQGEICPKIRKRLATLNQKEQSNDTL